METKEIIEEFEKVALQATLLVEAIKNQLLLLQQRQLVEQDRRMRRALKEDHLPPVWSELNEVVKQIQGEGRMVNPPLVEGQNPPSGGSDVEPPTPRAPMGK